MRMPTVRQTIRFVGVILLFILGLLVIAGGIVAVEIFSRKPLKAVVSTTHPSIERKACQECHAPIAEEWRQSFHYKSVSGPYWQDVREMGYLDLFDRARKPCLNCHAPANVLDLPGTMASSGGDAELGIECTPNILREAKGIIPAVRSDDVELGVDCVACHVSERGILGSGHHPAPEHETLPDRRFQDPALTSDTVCKTCHGSTVRAWKETKLAAEGVTCLDCHMPLVEAPSVVDGAKRQRRSHTFPADKDETMLRKAVNASLEITEDRQAKFRIVNDRAGHYLPSGANWLLVYLRAYDASGQLLKEHEEAFGRKEALLLDFWPFNVDTRIAFGEEKEIFFSFPEDTGSIEAEIRYWDWIQKVKTVLILKKSC